MPVDPLSLALMAVNVGASVFNNWRNNKQSQKLQEKQQDFARAAAERNKQRMWQLMREGQELALEMEHENHENRLADIRNDFDKILHKLAYAQAINSWPLKVLPIVMKNQSLGSLTAMANENIAMHCILTPSNCTAFNKNVLPAIEDKLADFCNLHWSNLSSHPVLFYSGAWKTGKNPTGIEIAQLKTNLSNLPTLLITPFFKPEGCIIFQLNIWGIGVELETEIECADFSYADSYKCGIDYQSDDDIKERTIEEFVPYLQCLIGYIADQYFWVAHNESPLLPTLLVMNVVNTDGMNYLCEISKERYNLLITTGDQPCKDMPFFSDKSLSLFKGSAILWDEATHKQWLEQIFIAYVSKISGESIQSMSEAIDNYSFTKNDRLFVDKFIELYQYDDYKSELASLLKDLTIVDFDYSILANKKKSVLEDLSNAGDVVASYRLGELYEYGMNVAADPLSAEKYYQLSAQGGFFLALAKTGKIPYSEISQRVIDILRMQHIVQIDVLFSDFILANTDSSDSLLEQGIVTIKETLDSISNKYGHIGLIFNWASLKVRKHDYSGAIPLLQFCDRVGYIKAKELLFNLKHK